jgi:predicted AlkP superfamily pyrophosphatase or phosphodiesterase
MVLLRRFRGYIPLAMSSRPMLSRSLFTTLLASAACAPMPSARAQANAPRPTLVVMLTVDQLRPDYLTMWEGQFTGGFARLLRGGAVFMNGFQDHANTETAPGHASTLSGRFPRSTGIVSNAAGVTDPQAPLIGARGAPASPFRFRGTTLVDWLRLTNPASKALSVSRKDRGAILPIGRAVQPVFWYAQSSGVFTTSKYYGDTLPAWVRAFNDRRLPHQWAGKTWDLLLDPSQYAEPDSMAHESGGQRYVFPHALPGDPGPAAAAIAGTPFMDQLTLSFALEGVRQMNLGQGPGTDVLAVSLSSTDAVGHGFGPDSREVHDQVVRLDRYLGAFLDTLFTLRDSTRIVIALTSDHGVTPLPMTKSRYPNQGAGKVNIRPAIIPLFASLRAAGVDTSGFAFDDEGILYLDDVALTQRGLRTDAVVRMFASEVTKVPGVLRVDRVSTLATRDTTSDYVARRWLHMLPPELPAAAVVTLRPYWYWSTVNFATHGSPHDSDANVPIIFYGAGVKPGRHTRKALVVDIAPTLAEIVGVRPMERLDGRPLREAIRP